MSDQFRQTAAEFIAWCNGLPQDRNRLRVFSPRNHKDQYYTIYGEHASQISHKYFGSSRSVQRYGDKDSYGEMDKISFKKQVLHKIMKEYVLTRKMLIEMYEIIDGNWEKTNTITERNLSDVDGISCFNIGDSGATIISVYFNFNGNSAVDQELGVAILNDNDFKCYITQFTDDTQFSNLQTLICCNNVKECIYYCKKADKNLIKKFEMILKKSGVKVIVTKGNLWNTKIDDCEQNITILLDKDSQKKLKTLIPKNIRIKYGVMSLNALITHSKILEVTRNHGKFIIDEYQSHKFMKLDGPAMAALNLFSKATDVGNQDNQSLYDVLKKCCTKMGNRLLSVWLRQPLVDIKEIKRRQRIVQCFVENDDIRQLLYEQQMKGLPDIDRIKVKILRRKCKLEDLVSLYDFCKEIDHIEDTLRQFKDCSNANNEDEKEESILNGWNIIKTQFVDQMAKMRDNFSNYKSLIENLVDLETAKSESKYIINARFDGKLRIIDREIKRVKHEIRNEADNFIGRHALMDTKGTTQLIEKDPYGWVIKVTNTNYNKKFGKRKKGKKNNSNEYINNEFKIVSKLKSNSYLQTKELKRASDEYYVFDREYKQRQEAIKDAAISIASTYVNVINKAVTVFSELDVLLALGNISVNAISQYTKPIILPNDVNPEYNKIIMKGARHPCLELQDFGDMGSLHKSEQCIPNDVSMIKNQSHFQIITGPNMGGKSTYIRMVGVIVLMAQIGCYVPCDRCEISICDSILARVGAGDNQLQGVSTFMAEMLEASTILNACSKNSLVIIDELGRGTSTYDGFGIAKSISHEIAKNKQSFCLFATHFHELTILSNECNGVINKHVNAMFRNELLTMTYQIRDGACPKSFGLQVAQLAKFPKNIIDMAKNKANELERQSMNDSRINIDTFEQIKQIISLYKNILKNKYSNNNDIKHKMNTQILPLIQQNKQKNPDFLRICNEFNDLMDIDS